MSNELQQISGMVEHVVFRNDTNDWTVIEVSSDGKMETVVGKLPPVSVGETVVIKGKYVTHTSFGLQFQAETLEREMPSDQTAILRYLSSGAVKGVGPATAVKIVKKFGDDTLKIIEDNFSRLSEISGISLQKAELIHQDFIDQYGLRKALMQLSAFGLTASESMRCWKHWGVNATTFVSENPYILCNENVRIGFERVDALCSKMNILEDDQRRIEAGILYVLRHNLQNGHTCLPKSKLVSVAATMLGVAEEPVTDVADKMVQNETLACFLMDKQDFLALPKYFDAENETAMIVGSMIKERPFDKKILNKWLKIEEEKLQVTYVEEQRKAIETALTHYMMILTGGPGTGKTTTLKSIINLLKEQGEKVFLTAPTGRAAKRMTDLTGEDACTIHRLLEVQWDAEDEQVFEKNRFHPLDADTVIVDEVSMVDVPLFHSLLSALKPKCRLIIVGDTNQLPAVGPGNVLGDLLDSGLVPTIHLEHVFRQAMESQIVTNAHRIVSGETPELLGPEADFFIMQRNSFDSTLSTLTELCNDRLPKKYHTDIWNGIQVLTPGKKGRLGTEELNKHLQNVCNPASEEKREWALYGKIFREGDKVMQTKNDYQLEWSKDNGEHGVGVYNGDIGVLERISKRDDQLVIRLDDGREVVCSHENAENLEHAYCVTIHKSQGSEFDIVVIPLYEIPNMLCYRNLLYTAVTRAKNLLVIVGEKSIVDKMVENHRQTRRYSALKSFLKEDLEK